MTKNLPLFGISATFLPLFFQKWQPIFLEIPGFFSKSATLPLFFILSYEKKLKIKKEFGFESGKMAEVHDFGEEGGLDIYAGFRVCEYRFCEARSHGYLSRIPC